MTSRWLLSTLSSMKNVRRPNSQSRTGLPEEQNLHSGQFTTKFFNATEDTFELQNDRGLTDDDTFQVACETCAGSSRCLNFLHNKQIKVSWGLKPLLIVGTLLGLIHQREKGRRSRPKSYFYSFLVVLVVWANFFRFFQNYNDSKSYGSRLFTKLTMHVWYGQTAVSQTLFFYSIAPSLPQLFAAWNKYSRQYHCTSAQHVRSRALRHICLMVLFIIFMVACTIGTIILEDPYNVSVNSRFLMNVYNTTSYSMREVRVFQGLFALYTMFAVSHWIWPTALLVALSSGLRYNYLQITASIAKNYDKMDTHSLEQARRRHQNLCSIVRKADGLFSFYFLLVYMTTIPLICFTIYNFTFRSSRDATVLEIVTLTTHTVTLSGQLIILTITASSLSRQVCINCLQSMKYRFCFIYFGL